MRQQVLRPVDVAVALRLAVTPDDRYESLAEVLGVSLSTAHQAVQRLKNAGLVSSDRKVNPKALFEFLVHGARYSFFPELGPETRGVPTAHSAPPLDREIVSDERFVWPSARGQSRGTALSPLLETADELPDRDHKLYQALALLDAVRVGRARERKLAIKHLEQLLSAGSVGES